ARLLGTVMNNVRAGRRGYHGYRGYYYSGSYY
ncbi:MAG: capsular biosynthesis protein, partial [Rubrobacteraceae bacterium]|nr:capsular biosynthesis protein [Rubrobacteraceae bacterium]